MSQDEFTERAQRLIYEGNPLTECVVTGPQAQNMTLFLVAALRAEHVRALEWASDQLLGGDDMEWLQDRIAELKGTR